MTAPLFLHVFSTFVPAGPQVRVAKLLAAFGSEFRHVIVAMDGRTDARALLDSGLDVRFVDAPSKAGSLATVLRMRKLIARAAPQLVLTYNFGAIDSVLAARSLGLRVVHHEDGFLPDEVLAFKKRRVWLRRLACGGNARVVVISENLRRIARERWHIAEPRLVFIPNGIECARFSAADGHAQLRDELGIPRDALVVGAVGHLRPEKNLPRLLEAVAECATRHDVHALILGEGPERNRLEALAATPALRGRVHFAGYHPDPRAHYRAMDVFALSSNTEQMPIALLESMASSLPVVATDVGDVRAMLPREAWDGVVALREPGTSAAFASALERLLADRALRLELGARNRRRVEQDFDFAVMVARYRELYGAALATR